MVLKTRSLYVYGLILIAVGGILFAVSIPSMLFWKTSWTAVDETFVIQPRYAKAICRSFPSDTILTIYVDVLEGGDRAIDFLVMDRDDFYSYTRGEMYSYYKETYKPRVSETTFRWSPPPDREICFVYSNTDLYTSRTVYTKIEAMQYYLSEVYRGSALVATGGVLLVVGIAMLVVYRQRSIASQKQITSNQEQPA